MDDRWWSKSVKVSILLRRSCHNMIKSWPKSSGDRILQVYITSFKFRFDANRSPSTLLIIWVRWQRLFVHCRKRLESKSVQREHKVDSWQVRSVRRANFKIDSSFRSKVASEFVIFQLADRTIDPLPRLQSVNTYSRCLSYALQPA